MKNTMQARDAAVYMNTFGQRALTFTHGQGALLYDENGKEYIDFLAGIAVNALGYGHPHWVQAVADQAQKLAHVSNFFYNEPQTTLAERLTVACGMDKAFFCNSGAEANEGAIKLARRYGATHFEKPRYKVISLSESFHGRTLASLAATGQQKYQAPFAPLPEGFVQVPRGDLRALADQAQDAAALLIEPIQGESGVCFFSKEYWAGVQEICAKTGMLLMLDEVQTGVGRTGTLLACVQMGIQPDVVTLAKGLGGGLPIGAILCKNHCDCLTPGQHGTTFGGNPLCCAAANAVLDVLTEDFLFDVQAKGQSLLAGLKQLCAKHDKVCLRARGLGLMCGLQLQPEAEGVKAVRTMMEQGFIINCAGNNTLRFVPPLVVDEAQIQAMLTALDGVLAGL